MFSMRHFVTVSALVVGASAAYASPISFTETAVGSGTLGGVAFSGQQITLTGLANTTSISTLYPGVYIVPLTADTLQIGDGAAVTFTDPILVFANNGAASVGFTEGGGPQDVDIVNIANPAFAAYGLDSGISQSGSASATEYFSFGTSAGDFAITSLDPSATFTAAVTPEPSSLILLGTFVAGIAARVRRRRGRQYHIGKTVN